MASLNSVAVDYVKLTDEDILVMMGLAGEEQFEKELATGRTTATSICMLFGQTTVSEGRPIVVDGQLKRVEVGIVGHELLSCLVDGMMEAVLTYPDLDAVMWQQPDSRLFRPYFADKRRAGGASDTASLGPNLKRTYFAAVGLGDGDPIIAHITARAIAKAMTTLGTQLWAARALKCQQVRLSPEPA